ncbi:hypothetical protein Aduo_000135 [Ancylostoma duodenale]
MWGVASLLWHTGWGPKKQVRRPLAGRELWILWGTQLVGVQSDGSANIRVHAYSTIKCLTLNNALANE